MDDSIWGKHIKLKGSLLDKQLFLFKSQTFIYYSFKCIFKSNNILCGGTQNNARGILQFE